MGERPLLAALTAIRFPLALWVVVYHVSKPWLVSHDGALRNVVAGAPVAVPFFFVLSGFVLAYTYRDGLRPLAYARARVARIAPIYLLAVLLAVPIGLAARARGIVVDEAPMLSLALVLSGVQAWFPAFALRWNPALWSVSVEMFLYLCFPLVLAATARVQGRAALFAALTCGLAAALPPVAYLALQPDGPMPGGLDDEGTWFFVVRFNPALRLFELAAGVFAARAWLGGVRVAPALGIAVLLLLGALLASGVAPAVFLFGGGTALLSVVAVLSLASLDRGPLVSRAAVALGESSYALYALHLPVFFWLLGVARRAPADVTVPFSLVVVLTSVAIASAAHRFLEEPARRAINRRR